MEEGTLLSRIAVKLLRFLFAYAAQETAYPAKPAAAIAPIDPKKLATD